MMKIHMGSNLQELGQISGCAIARDGVGTFQGASVLVAHGVTDPETMEAIACREGLALTSDLAFRKVRPAGQRQRECCDKFQG